MKDKRHAKHKYANKSNLLSIFKEGFAFKGILLTCDAKKEKFAVRDAYRIINDHIGKYRIDAPEDEDIDLDKQLEAKLAGTLANPPVASEMTENKPKREFMSQQIQIKGKGLVFIKLNEKLLRPEFDVETFALEVLEDAYARNDKLSKDIFRFIPADVACLASFDNFKLFIADLVARKMKESETHYTWSLVYKCRNNNKFAKFEFTDFLAEIIPPNFHRIDYNGNYNVIVDITQHFMVLLITSHFVDSNKFSMTKKEKKETGDKGEAQPEKLDEEAREDVDRRGSEAVNDEASPSKSPRKDGEEGSDIDIF